MKWTVKFLLAWSIGLVIWGCSGKSTTGGDGSFKQISWSDYLEERSETDGLVLAQGDAGRIHNEVLTAFDKRRPLTDRGEMSRGELADLFAAAVNDVNKAHGLEANFETMDALAMEAYLDELSRVYDAWGYTRNQDPFAVVDNLYANGRITSSVREELRALVQAYYNSRGRRDRPVLVGALDVAVTSQSRLVRDAASMMAASSQFWDKTEPPAKIDSENTPSQITFDLYLGRTITDVMVAASFAGTFPMFAPFANHVGALASIAFHCVVEYVLPAGDDDDDYEVPLWADPTL